MEPGSVTGTKIRRNQVTALLGTSPGCRYRGTSTAFQARDEEGEQSRPGSDVRGGWREMSAVGGLR